jgi:hypothetical protein
VTYFLTNHKTVYCPGGGRLFFEEKKVLVTLVFLGIFPTSKKNRKLEEKEKDGLKSCLISEEKKQLKRKQRGLDFIDYQFKIRFPTH